MIISSFLDENIEEKLLDVLKKDMDVEDIKGISPSIFMHKILMEEDYKPTIKHQRWLKPAMKEVVKKEVLKWLHAEFIFAMSDSSWGSPVQVVLKKVA